jgi:CRISPR-associated endonuclease Cas2
MRFLVTYDLKRPGQNYQPLWDALVKLGAKRVLESVWYLRGNSYTAAQLREYLWTFMDQNDRLLVVRFDDWAGYNVMNDIA